MGWIGVCAWDVWGVSFGFGEGGCLGLRVDVLGVCACWVVLGHGGLGLGVGGGV